jgi:hypothetical protein
MVELQGSFTANKEDVAAKVIDGELIMIRLSDGTYYSMENVGTQVWELIQAQHELPAVAETIASWYGTPAGQVEGDLAALVLELLAERLIIAAAHETVAAKVTEAPPDLLAYETPRLNIYRDMGNLLALDPPTPGIDDLMFRDGKAP